MATRREGVFAHIYAPGIDEDLTDVDAILANLILEIRQTGKMRRVRQIIWKEGNLIWLKLKTRRDKAVSSWDSAELESPVLENNEKELEEEETKQYGSCKSSRRKRRKRYHLEEYSDEDRKLRFRKDLEERKFYEKKKVEVENQQIGLEKKRFEDKNELFNKLFETNQNVWKSRRNESKLMH